MSSRLEELQKTVEKMTESELMEYIRGIRSKRYNRPVAKATRAKNLDKARSALAGLDPEVLKQMLEKLK